MKKIIIFAVLTLVLFTACSQQQAEPKQTENLKDTAKKVVEILKNKNLQKLSEYVHPSKGVRFSPYATVDPQNDIVFKSNELKGKFNDDTVYTWGRYDGSGKPIELTFTEYYNEFIYDEDFANAENFATNELIQTGNSISNIEEVYPDAEFAEFNFSGFEDQYEGMDWTSLRLVFEKYQNSWKLIGIIHDQWTI
jgi:hypothetical protein